MCVPLLHWDGRRLCRRPSRLFRRRQRALRRLSRRTVGRGAVLPKAQITLLGGVGILLIPGSILLPHLPTHLSGQKCAAPQKNDNCI